jgi:hypothetical protein
MSGEAVYRLLSAVDAPGPYVETGTPLTFAGTVTLNHGGERVLLQRQIVTGR